jgi:16S rRNA (adenine1518-N6/adenine1519-N6)-dimethyltransferase
MSEHSLESDNLPPLRDVIKTHALSAKKNLGQNFLLDLNITRKIARHAGAGTGDHFLEIGAGPGGLTRALFLEGAASVTIVEKDMRCLPALEQIADIYPNKLHIVHGDALDTDLERLMEKYPHYRIAANLPYNISSEILTHWLSNTHWPPRWTSATLMYQKEFADRLRATHENDNIKEYGRLSVLCGWRADIQKIMDVHPSNFTPPPKVMSCVITVTPKQNIIPCDIKNLENITRAAFGGRRKMLRQSLKSITDNPEKLCFDAGVNPQHRADHISIMEYLKLANLL